MILFCRDPMGRWQPDSDYLAEAEAATAAGADWGLLDFEALAFEGDVARAVRRITSAPEPEWTIYRGWTLGQERYAALAKALAALNRPLINTAAEYRFCQQLPCWYPALAAETPRSVWLPTEGAVSLSRVLEELAEFGGAPVVLKDFVKSEKHHWEAACFIPSAADKEAVSRVVSRFLQLRGTELEGGLVFREFVDLQPAGVHPRSGMPLTQEYRIFVLDGEPVVEHTYWKEGAYEGDGPPWEYVQGLIDKVKSRFFTLDVARLRTGGWTLIEVGDAQVAGLTDPTGVPAFYQMLTARLAAAGDLV